MESELFGELSASAVYTRGLQTTARGRIRPDKVSNPARGALPENINMGRKTANDFGNYPF